MVRARAFKTFEHSSNDPYAAPACPARAGLPAKVACAPFATPAVRSLTQLGMRVAVTAPRALPAAFPAAERDHANGLRVRKRELRNGLRKRVTQLSEGFHETHYRNHQAVQAR
ncbi:conserved protein of unknown function [Paraburkholderia dioscoreae]|uniref:Uncharacterized protein n=1 Tax=Paraburkholderia dioscoreae TaxID=2604047 RepID=A0A5Q4Z1J0_9BURK|nr:conserved protein of unknown function [Paraburkholderia dioscoreae]